jgi:hypothetical protein
MPSRREQFIRQEIDVVRDKKSGDPVSFRWNDAEYRINNVIAVWPDWGFAAGSPRRKNWRMRRHRNCYRVETVDGAVFELYHDRGLGLSGGKWILYSRLEQS